VGGEDAEERGEECLTGEEWWLLCEGEERGRTVRG